ILKLAARGRSTRRSRSGLERIAHVGAFSYVQRRGDSFVTWSTFRRRAKAVWVSSTMDRAILVCESIDRRAQALLAGSTPQPRTIPKRNVSNGAPLPES